MNIMDMKETMVGPDETIIYQEMEEKGEKKTECCSRLARMRWMHF